MTVSDVAALVGVAVSVGTVIGGMVLWAGRIALTGAITKELTPLHEEMRPLREAILGLQSTAQQLAREISEGKQAQRESRTELHDAVEAIRDVLRKHEERFGSQDTRIAVLESTATGAKIRPTRRKP